VIHDKELMLVLILGIVALPIFKQ